MGRRFCSVLNCPSGRDRGSKKSFFAPPLKDPALLRKWEEALKERVDPSAFPFSGKTLVCQLHFKPDQLDDVFMMKMPDGSTWTKEKERIKLFPNSVPCVFTTDLSTIEVKAPKSKQTYVFDIEDSDDPWSEEEDEGGAESEQNEDNRENEFEGAKSQDNRGDGGQSERVLSQEGSTSSRTDKSQIEIIFSEVIGDGSDGDDLKIAEVVGRATPDSVESRDEREVNESSLTDVRAILGPPETEKCVINDVNEFSKLCRKYIVTKLTRRGRPSQMQMHGLDSPSPGSTKRYVYLYPTAKLNIETLVSHIDHVKLPSDDWFCTAKDGSPTFLCWNDNFFIHKKVIFEMKNLLPIVHLGDRTTSLSEIAKPRSIQEVNNILKLVDSAEKCPEENSSVCKGYFFPATSKGVNMCHPCKTALNSKSRQVEPLTLKLVKDSAEEIISEVPNWSVTVLGTAVIFIGWKSPYIPEKLYIIKSDLKAQVMFGEKCAFFDRICSPQTLEDVRFALRFLAGCVRCTGIDVLHRSNRCRGFTYVRTPRSRNRTCNACADLKKKLIRAVPGNSQDKQTKAEHSFSTGSLKVAAKSVPTWIKEEENSNDQTLEDDEEHILLTDALDAIALPSHRWTSTVVDGTVIFQYWKDDFTPLKKVMINHDLSVQISVLDRIVQLEDVDVVSSVDDVVRILVIVDCVRVCEGYDESYSKDKDCSRFIYDTNEGESAKRPTPYRCPKCAAVRRSHLGFDLRKKSVTKSRFQLFERDDTEGPSSKKVAPDISLSPFSSRFQYPGSPTDDER